jgi:hypothetical protein
MTGNAEAILPVKIGVGDSEPIFPAFGQRPVYRRPPLKSASLQRPELCSRSALRRKSGMIKPGVDASTALRAESTALGTESTALGTELTALGTELTAPLEESTAPPERLALSAPCANALPGSARTNAAAVVIVLTEFIRLDLLNCPRMTGVNRSGLLWFRNYGNCGDTLHIASFVDQRTLGNV